MANNNKKLGIASLRHLQIDKDNSYIFIAVAAAAVCLIFSLVAAQSLWKQAGYNKRVIDEKKKTVSTLKENVANIENLESSYKTWVQQPTNIMEGSSTGTGDRDGDNAKIVLDSLPSVYDFPGLVSGLDKVLNTQEFGQVSIEGKDDEVAQKVNTTPALVDIVLDFKAAGSIESSQAFLDKLFYSIRPVSINTVKFTGRGENIVELDVNATTYYQPKKQFEVKTEVIQ